MVKQSDLEPRIITAWLQRPAGQRSERDVFPFYQWLQQHEPHLLNFRASGDKYQVLKTVLRDHFER